VTPYYDPMIAKLIAHGLTRQAALDRLADALVSHTRILGPRTNVSFLAALCRAREFHQGQVDTGYIDRNLGFLGAVPHASDHPAAALGVERLLDKLAAETSHDATPRDEEPALTQSPWATRDGFQLGGARRLGIPVLVDGKDTQADVTYGKDGPRVTLGGVGPATDAAAIVLREDEAYILRQGRQTRVRLTDFSLASSSAQGGDGMIKAPMHGRVLQLFVAVGEAVAGGQRLAIIEAMKMEHTLHAPFAGVVRNVAVVEGTQVVEGGEIMLIEPPENR
jgi:3-methylcrotonyl-CoA carboxylase alpha subunit